MNEPDRLLAIERLRRFEEIRESIERRDSIPEYEHPDDPVAIEFYRDEFLRAVVHVRPELLRSLADEPLAAFVHRDNPGCPFFPDMKDALLGAYAGPLHLMAYPSSNWEISAACQAATTAWARMHHLDTDWVLVRALFTMSLWKRNPEAAGRLWLCARDLPIALRVPQGVPFAGVDRWGLLWDVQRESKKDYRARRRAAGEPVRETARYIQKVEKAAKATNLRSAPKKLRNEHFEWLARYQMDETETSVSMSYGIEHLSNPDSAPRAVSDAIVRTAELIGLPLRPASVGGRPKKS